MENNHAAYYFHQGTNFYSYKYLGCSVDRVKNYFVYTFRVWAPKAESVFLVSDFSDWEQGIALVKITDAGIWECVYKSLYLKLF